MKNSRTQFPNYHRPMPGPETGQLLIPVPRVADRPRLLLAPEALELRPEEMLGGDHLSLLWPPDLGPQSETKSLKDCKHGLTIEIV